MPNLMDSYFKKRSPENGLSTSAAKRQKPGLADGNAGLLASSPRRIVAWNCNGLTSRLRSPSDGDEIKRFVAERKPDVIFLSEVRIAAANNSAAGKPGPQTKWFRSKMRESDKKSTEDASLVRSFLASPELKGYTVYYSLADTKYAGTAMLLNNATTQPPKSVRYNMERLDVKASVHDPDGRVIVAKFGEFSILHTYAPNNGWEEEHFKRRRAWDEKVRSFMDRKRAAGVRIMWIGDLNVAPADVDLSHAAHYRRQKGGRYAKKGGPPISQEDIGQPGCTDSERRRFEAILEAGDMVDAYREFVGEEDASGLTWRGNTTGKHAGRGMRIDHCIASRNLVGSIRSVEVTGHGTDRIGFMGSDHCPLVVAVGAKNHTGPTEGEVPEAKTASTDFPGVEGG